MLFLYPSSAGPSSENMDTAQPHTSSSYPSFPSSFSSSSSLSRSHSAPQIPEDEIDQYLSKQEGKIYRNRDPQLWVGFSFHTTPETVYLYSSHFLEYFHSILLSYCNLQLIEFIAKWGLQSTQDIFLFLWHSLSLFLRCRHGLMGKCVHCVPLEV